MHRPIEPGYIAVEIDQHKSASLDQAGRVSVKQCCIQLRQCVGLTAAGVSKDADVAVENARVGEGDGQAFLLEHPDAQPGSMRRPVKGLGNTLIGKQMRLVPNHGQELDAVMKPFVLEVADGPRVNATDVLGSSTDRLALSLVQEFAFDDANNVPETTGNRQIFPNGDAFEPLALMEQNFFAGLLIDAQGHLGTCNGDDLAYPDHGVAPTTGPSAGDVAVGVSKALNAAKSSVPSVVVRQWTLA